MKNLTHISAKILLLICCISSILIISCRKTQQVLSRSETPILPTTPYQYLTVMESGRTKEMGELIKDLSGDQLSNSSVTLGRVLFYDTRLSINNTISCGSCHKQALAFADNVSFSTGFSDKKTLRNSMSILNSVNNNNMFWDSRARSPLELSLMPVFNHLEMGIETDAMLVSKLYKTSYYPELFNKAFGSTTITREKISLAITQFINCLFSKNSKFDKGMGNVSLDSPFIKDINPTNFTPIELQGKNLFFSEEFKCSKCHVGSNFSAPDLPVIPGTPPSPLSTYGGESSTSPNAPDNGPRGTANIGLDMIYTDNGRSDGKFKIPGLRNIALTAPYMHDGRFKTLDEVLNHYSHGIKKHPNLDDKFIVKGKAIQMNFTESEKFAIISFLNTLTDENLITNPKFSDPFIIR